MHIPLNIAICDDSNHDANLLVKLIEDSNFTAKVAVFSNSADFLQTYTSTKYDLIFMDIYMPPGMSGIKVVEKIRQIDEQTLIAFTTNSLDHTLESYRLGIVKYIEKPATAKIVRQLLSLAILKQKDTPSITFTMNFKKQTIPLDKIIYLEQYKHLVRINTNSGQYSTEAKLAAIEPKLPHPPFFRSHQSYIVNLYYVRCLDKEFNVFIMSNGENAYIRRESMKDAKNVYENYLFSLARSTNDAF